MSKIKIRNFGPIKSGFQENDGWIDIRKATVFIGNQGSGKSTVAKLISTLTWLEKALVRGDFKKNRFERQGSFKSQLLKYHRLDNYFPKGDGLFDNTEIEYAGEAFHFTYKKGALHISENQKWDYPLPQIMYVPAERNFIGYVQKATELKLSSDSLKEFLTEYNNAIRKLNGGGDLPINNAIVEYDKLNDKVNIKGENYKVRLTDASSGFQSFVPLFLVSQFLAKSVLDQSRNKESMSTEEMNRFKNGVAEIWSNDNLTDEQKRIAISVLSSKFNKTAFVNIVEEPEQNLFPSSQWQLLKSLLEFNNLNEGNNLIMTTHSPYIINYLSVVIQANTLKGMIKNDKALIEKLNNIVPVKSLINSSDVAIFQLNENDGSISKLGSYEGIPSDANYLNESLADGNRLFDSLLEIEQEL